MLWCCKPVTCTGAGLDGHLSPANPVNPLIQFIHWYEMDVPGMDGLSHTRHMESGALSSVR